MQCVSISPTLTICSPDEVKTCTVGNWMCRSAGTKLLTKAILGHRALSAVTSTRHFYLSASRDCLLWTKSFNELLKSDLRIWGKFARHSCASDSTYKARVEARRDFGVSAKVTCRVMTALGFRRRFWKGLFFSSVKLSSRQVKRTKRVLSVLFPTVKHLIAGDELLYTKPKSSISAKSSTLLGSLRQKLEGVVFVSYK